MKIREFILMLSGFHKDSDIEFYYEVGEIAPLELFLIRDESWDTHKAVLPVKVLFIAKVEK